MTPPFVMEQEAAEALVGHPLPKELFEHVPIGHRIVVVLEKPRQRYGPIIVPKSSQKRPARGWVVAAGELCGTRWAPVGGEAVGWWPIGRRNKETGEYRSDPSTMLGAQVVFSAYAGEALLIEPDEASGKSLQEWADEMQASGMEQLETYRSPYRLMTDNDIWLFRRGTEGHYTKE